MSAPSAHILYVDDDEIVRLFTAEMLRSSGHRVTEASSREQALQVFEQQHADVSLLILDLRLGCHNGADLLAEMRRIDSRANAIVLTGLILDEEKEANLRRAGFRAVLAKPARFEDLQAAISEALGFSAPHRGDNSHTANHLKAIFPALDTEQALQRLNYDTVLYVRLLERIAQQWEAMLDEMRHVADRPSIDHARMYAHTLKANAAQAGHMGLTAMFQQMETSETAVSFLGWLSACEPVFYEFIAHIRQGLEKLNRQ